MRSEKPHKQVDQSGESSEDCSLDKPSRRRLLKISGTGLASAMLPVGGAMAKSNNSNSSSNSVSGQNEDDSGISLNRKPEKVIEVSTADSPSSEYTTSMARESKNPVSITVMLYSGGIADFNLEGQSPESKKAYKLDLQGAFDSNGEVTSDQASVEVNRVEPPDPIKGGHDEGQVVKKTSEISPADNVDEGDGGTVHANPYHGSVGTQIHAKHAGYYASAETSSYWNPRNGDPINNIQWNHQWDLDPQFHQQDHGITYTNWGGSGVQQKTFYKQSFNSSTGGAYYDIYHRHVIKGRANGSMKWRGRIFTRRAGRGSDPTAKVYVSPNY